jgi:hypothetical protein
VRATAKLRLDSVVRECVEKLQSEADGRDSTEVAVRATIRMLRELGRGTSKGRSPFRGNRQENKENFTTLLKEIKDLQKALKQMSGAALFLLFSGEHDVSSDKIPSSEIRQGVERRILQVGTTLAYMRARCDFLLAERPGEHGSVDYLQRRVAHETWHLMRQHRKVPAGGMMDRCRPPALHGPCDRRVRSLHSRRCER